MKPLCLGHLSDICGCSFSPLPLMVHSGTGLKCLLGPLLTLLIPSQNREYTYPSSCIPPYLSGSDIWAIIVLSVALHLVWQSWWWVTVSLNRRATPVPYFSLPVSGPLKPQSDSKVLVVPSSRSKFWSLFLITGYEIALWLFSC